MERFSKYYNKIIKINNFTEFTKIVDNFSNETELIEKCDKLKRYITKYVMNSAFRLIPPEKMAEKIIKQKYEVSNLKFRIVRKQDRDGETKN